MIEIGKGYLPVGYLPGAIYQGYIPGGSYQGEEAHEVTKKLTCKQCRRGLNTRSVLGQHALDTHPKKRRECEVF